jgi:Domain of unknown function (DUF4411)
MYLVDANVFIQAKNAHYGFDFCPGFWQWLLDAGSRGVLASVDRIGEELRDGDDELADWAKDHAQLFVAADDPTVASLATLATWVRADAFTDAAVSEFLSSADYYLIAHAHAHGHDVVTHEKSSDTRNKVKIPNACIGVGVPWMLPWQMLREAGARFRL